MAERRVVKASMSTQDWEALVESTKRWAYDACRSDVNTDHPEGVKVFDKPFNELCAHVATGDAQDKWRQAYEGAVLEAKAVIAELEEGVKIWKQNTMNASRRIGELEERNKRLEDALKHYADADNWHAYDEGGYFTDHVVWMGIWGNEGFFRAGPDLALLAISELKKEAGDG